MLQHLGYRHECLQKRNSPEWKRLMIHFNFYFVMSVCLWIDACAWQFPRRVDPVVFLNFQLKLQEVVKNLTWILSRNFSSRLGPVFIPVNILKLLYIIWTLGNREEFIDERNPGHVNNMVKPLDIRIVFSFKRKKSCFISLLQKMP